MSKERLEKIEEIDREISNGVAIEDLNLNTMTIVNEEDFEWLIDYAKEQAERVQELEEKIHNWESGKWVAVTTHLELKSIITQSESKDYTIKDLEQQNKRYREAISNTLIDLMQINLINREGEQIKKVLKDLERALECDENS